MNLSLKTTLVVFMLCFGAKVMAQDSLILVNGRRIAYQQLNEFSDTIEIKTLDKEYLYFRPDSVMGYSESLKERAFFCKPNPDADDDYIYVFVERLISGKISLYEKTKGADAIYMEKGDRFEKVFDPIESGVEKDARFEVFASFVADDDESTSYIRTAGFDFKFKEIELVLEYYNQRNFEEKKPTNDDVRGKVYLYRTKFQKTKEGVKIRAFDGVHDLYIEDFIHLDLPVDYPSQLKIYDSFYKTEILLTGHFEDQFFEVIYDKKTNGFILDDKSGTELYMEFMRIRDKVGKRVGE